METLMIAATYVVCAGLLLAGMMKLVKRDFKF